VRDERGQTPSPRKEGYRKEDSPEGDMFLIDVPAQRSGEVFKSLAGLFLGPVFFLLEAPGAGAERVVYQSRLLTAAEALETLEPYFFRLFHNGRLGFGLAASTEMELWVTEPKTFRIFAAEPARVGRRLKRLGILEDPRHVFPDEQEGYVFLDLAEVPKLYRDVLKDPRDLSGLQAPSFGHAAVTAELIELLEMAPLDGNPDAL